MLKVQFSAAGLRRIVLDAPLAQEREFDLAALIAIRPHLLRADRALGRLVAAIPESPAIPVQDQPVGGPHD